MLPLTGPAPRPRLRALAPCWLIPRPAAWPVELTTTTTELPERGATCTADWTLEKRSLSDWVERGSFRTTLRMRRNQAAGARWGRAPQQPQRKLAATPT
eukprot:scaffold1896_cov121-Isochrysis_galbana.AAC.11